MLTLPGDVGGLDVPKGTLPPRFAEAARPAAASSTAIQDAADAITPEAKVTLLVGCGARGARDEVLSLAETLAAPIVLTL